MTNHHEIYYNPDYVRRRDGFIPDSEKFADEKAGQAPVKDEGENKVHYEKRSHEWGAKWNLLFHKEMNRLNDGRGNWNG